MVNTCRAQGNKNCKQIRFPVQKLTMIAQQLNLAAVLGKAVNLYFISRGRSGWQVVI